MSNLQNIELEGLIDKVEDCQTHIDQFDSNKFEWGMKMGEYLSQIQKKLKDDLGEWNSLHPPKERNEYADTKPLKYEEWCKKKISTQKTQRTKYVKIYQNKPMFKNVHPSEHFSITSGLVYIDNAADRLATENMTADEREDYYKKKNEAADKKKAKAAAKKKLAGNSSDEEVTKSEFFDAVSEYIPKEYYDAIENGMDDVPDYTEMLFISGRRKILASMTTLLKSDRKKLITALAQMAASQAESLILMMKDRPKYHRDAQARLDKATEEMEEKTAQLTADNVVAPDGSMTVSEYKLIRSVLHSDKESTTARKNKAFNVFTRAFGR